MFQPTIRFWSNPSTVIIGRFQKAESEVDVDLCRKHGITIIRRFTGGGAVYQDEGNLNFTVLNRRNGESITTIHETNSSLLIHSLRSMGVSANFIPPNSIHVDGRKISGGAAAINSNTVLWHASILVSSNTDRLNEVLSPSRAQIHSEFIRSRWHPVITLNQYLQRTVKMEEVTQTLINSTHRLTGIRLQTAEPSECERATADVLYGRKYATPEWNLNGISG